MTGQPCLGMRKAAELRRLRSALQGRARLSVVLLVDGGTSWLGARVLP